VALDGDPRRLLEREGGRLGRRDEDGNIESKTIRILFS
jgi:hypothetical protein